MGKIDVARGSDNPSFGRADGSAVRFGRSASAFPKRLKAGMDGCMYRTVKDQNIDHHRRYHAFVAAFE
jgi:hypothetical protein